MKLWVRSLLGNCDVSNWWPPSSPLPHLNSIHIVVHYWFSLLSPIRGTSGGSTLTWSDWAPVNTSVTHYAEYNAVDSWFVYSTEGGSRRRQADITSGSIVLINIQSESRTGRPSMSPLPVCVHRSSRQMCTLTSICSLYWLESHQLILHLHSFTAV